jgi:uncharacterized OB-fold protein
MREGEMSEEKPFLLNEEQIKALKNGGDLQDCEICGRLTVSKKGWCHTCFSLWYDGETDPVEIKRHSLHWPVDSFKAYIKSNYDD